MTYSQCGFVVTTVGPAGPLLVAYWYALYVEHVHLERLHRRAARQAQCERLRLELNVNGEYLVRPLRNLVPARVYRVIGIFLEEMLRGEDSLLGVHEAVVGEIDQDQFVLRCKVQVANAHVWLLGLAGLGRRPAAYCLPAHRHIGHIEDLALKLLCKGDSSQLVPNPGGNRITREPYQLWPPTASGCDRAAG